MLDQILRLTQGMLENAQEGIWEDVIEIEIERRKLLELLLTKPVDKASVEMVSKGLKGIMECDKKIMELGSAKQEALADGLNKMDRGKKAVKAYTN